MELGILCSGGLGYLSLTKLQQEYKVNFVFTDAKSEEIINFCRLIKVPLFVGNPRKGKAKTFIEKYNCDCIVSINYLFIIEEDVISMAKKLAFNVHGSLLPKYRGRTPHVWAIINGEKNTGITAHLIDSQCDTGDILEQIIIPISDDDTGGDILDKYKEHYYSLITSVLKKIKNDTLTKIVQDNSIATYFGKRTPDDGQINWEWSRNRIRNWIRAQANPYPGAFSFLGNKKVIIDRVICSGLGFNEKDYNGLIIKDTPNIVVKTPEGCIELLEVRSNKELCKKGKIFNYE